jgi:DNA-binding XRE family transcriptional regulator
MIDDPGKDARVVTEDGKQPGREDAGDPAAARSKNNLREFRIENMMSKAELARKAGLSVLTITRIENGFGCRMDTKRKILKALGLKVADRRKVFEDD